MLFKKTEELKTGMRLARPIYNKNGVLLYERNSRLSSQGIESIRNFGLIGIYILEPAEPVPPMTKADLAFERFQTMCVFAIGEELEYIRTTGKQKRMQFIVADIIKNYGHLDRKIHFVQNLRSSEDYIFKHAMNVAILAAILGNKMNLRLEERSEAVIAALVHDIGKLHLPAEMAARTNREPQEEIEVRNAVIMGYSCLDDGFPANPGIKRMCLQYQKLLEAAEKGSPSAGEEKIVTGAKILLIADIMDTMTAMRYGEVPVSEVLAVKHLLEHPEIYDPVMVKGLTESIHILSPGVSVELNNGDKALVLAENSNHILRPVVLNFRDNTIIDLSSVHVFQEVEIVDIMKTMDNRYVMDTDALRSQGIRPEEPESIKEKDGE